MYKYISLIYSSSGADIVTKWPIDSLLLIGIRHEHTTTLKEVHSFNSLVIQYTDKQNTSLCPHAPALPTEVCIC